MAETQPEGGREKDLAEAPRTAGQAVIAMLAAPAAWVVRGFLQLVDTGIPARIRSGEPDELRRARIILGFTLFLILLGLETAVFFNWILSPDASQRVNLALVVALSLTLLIPLSFRVLSSLAVGANLMLTAAFIVSVSIYTVGGGIHSPLIHWLALLPMLAALMGARSSAWSWTLIALLTVVFLISADAAGYRFTDSVGFSQLQGSALWFQRFINLCSWLGILLAVALLFDGQKTRQTTKLAAQNAELESQIEQRYKAEQLSQYLAYYDDLTGLPNRRLFLEELGTAVDQNRRRDQLVALLFLDLDGFKEVNDLHGHALGDQLLQQVAGRLLRCVRQADKISHDGGSGGGDVARLGGDEFTILLSGLHGHTDAASVAERIIEQMRQPFLLGDVELHIGTSIGIAVLGSGGLNAGDLLRNADLAMYQAKSAGKNNYKFHDTSMNADITERNRMTGSLRKALDGGELELHYQCVVDAQCAEVTGVEALVRWPRPEDGPVPTDVLISLAEESGLIIPLGDWVIREACRQYREWQGAGAAPPRVSVNVSVEQFRRGAVVEVVRDSLEEFGLKPGELEVEITEGAMMVDEARTLAALEELKLLGVGIALDDFGTGFSSLSYVHRFPVDAVKIDRSFVADVEEDDSSRAITMAVIALANLLGLRVVGEGVENMYQAEFLRENGCDELQGFLYNEPVPGPIMARLLARLLAQRERAEERSREQA